MTQSLVLAVDLGGSKTLLQVTDYAGDSPRLIAERAYVSRAYPDFYSMLAEFLVFAGCTSVHAACIAVAGPVQGEFVRLTNLPWTLDMRGLAHALGTLQVRIINDMQGMAYGLLDEDAAALRTLHEGTVEEHGTRALLGIGTGLGVGMMIWTGREFQALPSEGGHVDFSPRDDFEMDLWRSLKKQRGQVSWESILSGPGLVRLYLHLCRSKHATSSELEAAMAIEDPAAAIVRFAQQKGDATARYAIERFVRLIGIKAAHLALTCFATGGVYLVGGIPGRLSEELTTGRLAEAFLDNLSMDALLQRIPVRVAMNPGLALLGARRIGRSLL
jgi:glucokinase